MTKLTKLIAPTAVLAALALAATPAVAGANITDAEIRRRSRQAAAGPSALSRAAKRLDRPRRRDRRPAQRLESNRVRRRRAPSNRVRLRHLERPPRGRLRHREPTIVVLTTAGTTTMATMWWVTPFRGLR